MKPEWFDTTAGDLTHILAAIMHVKPSKADRIVNATVFQLGGVGATAGIYGVASLFGTAGTGTAIGTLSGAAANSATLAWVGGTVFSGTIIVAGIAFVGGWGVMRLWRGKPRKYDNLTENEEKIVNACASLGKAFKEQAKIETLPSKAELQVVVKEGLIPLKDSLTDYLKPTSYKSVVVGPLSVGARSRLFFRQRKLTARIAEAEAWISGYDSQ